MTKLTPITSQDLRQRVAGAYQNMAELAASMRDMAFLAGVLAACDAVAGLEHEANTDKTTELHLPTMRAVIEHMRNLAMQTAEGVVMMEQIDPDTVQTMPPGVKAN